jgi:hypothetical protein
MPQSKKARELYREKLVLRSGLIREAVVWGMPKNAKYPDGVRYRLALVEPSLGKILVLFDNHYPKGHHRHFSDGSEEAYPFTDVENLIEEYLASADQEEKRYESKKNKN